jgi:DMSO/TMAO reductase YedYZ molybdopterin-dependent catalytic subunit
MKFITALLLSGICASTVRSQVTVVVDGTPKTIAARVLQQLPRDTATMLFHEQPPVRYEGVSLAAVLREAGVRTDSLHGPALATRLVIEASDGYRIVLALSDLDPSLGGKRVLLADRVDGKPLPADEAPWRLIIPGDQRPARSARQVVRIRVIREQ